MASKQTATPEPAQPPAPAGQSVDSNAVIQRLVQRIAALELEVVVRDSIIAQMQDAAPGA